MPSKNLDPMNDEPRKRSPRSPVLPLRESLARALAIHEKEGRHSVPIDVAAQDMGYKDSNNGRARRAIAALRQFGLVITPKNGYVAVSRQLETYRFAPDESTKRTLLMEFFRTPPIYRAMVAKFPDRLPSDAALRFEFIQLGFLPAGVDDEVKMFRDSAEFSGAYAANGIAAIDQISEDMVEHEIESVEHDQSPTDSISVSRASQVADRIPIRLAGGRKAVLEIPTPFFEADKRLIKAQIDLVLTNDHSETSEQ